MAQKNNESSLNIPVGKLVLSRDHPEGYDKI